MGAEAAGGIDRVETCPTGGIGDAAMARAHSAEALATLVAIMTNGEAPATARVSAANAVLDRAWGKPRQDLELASSREALAAIQRGRLANAAMPAAIGVGSTIAVGNATVSTGTNYLTGLHTVTSIAGNQLTFAVGTGFPGLPTGIGPTVTPYITNGAAESCFGHN